MTNRILSLATLGCALLAGLVTAPAAAAGQDASPQELRLVSSRISLSGTSNIHAYTASSTAARLVRLQVSDGVAEEHAWDALLAPGALQALEISLPAATLSSPREGLDKNMHKALKVTEHRDITFRLSRLETVGAGGAVRGIGVLTVAGVERDVTLAIKTARSDAGLTVTGEVQLLMTDFGIAPPKAMLGMLKTDPRITVTFEALFAIPRT
ncbi:MAG: YceI family protein [Vicinamibacterales bacterium]